MDCHDKPLDVFEKPTEFYGIPPQKGWTQLSYERAAIVHKSPHCNRAQVMRKISNRLTPGYFEWHAWTEMVFDAISSGRQFVGITGAGGSGKSHNVMGYAVNWWLCEPAMSSVTIVSTTIKALRKRAWANIEDCWRRSPRPEIGHLVSSDMTWRATPGDTKHAIIGRAVDQGRVEEIADDIKGHHTERQMLILEEATGIAPAIWEAAFNLWFGSHREFVMIANVNLRSWIDSAGKFFTPIDGVESLNPDTDFEWETKPMFGTQPGLAIRFDALQSPNIVEGEVVSRHLPTAEKVQAAIKRYGGDKDPLYWANVRGFPPPEGIASTVLNEQLLRAGNAFDPVHQFSGPTIVVGGFDPNASFTGDKPALRLAKCGPLAGGGHGIQFFKPMSVPLDAKSNVPIGYQLARGCKHICEEYGCPPENLTVDVSGNNSSAADVMTQEWGPVGRVNFQGRASDDRTVSNEDMTLCCDKFRDKVTEMWFNVSHYVKSGQIRGLDTETATQFCSRYWYGGEGNQKMYLEPKAKKPGDRGDRQGYKERLGHSPDAGDAAAAACESARRRGIIVRKVGLTAAKTTNWSAEREAYDAIAQNSDYMEPEPVEEMV